jgi:hypothetical protein
VKPQGHFFIQKISPDGEREMVGEKIFKKCKKVTKNA